MEFKKDLIPIIIKLFFIPLAISLVIIIFFIPLGKDINRARSVLITEYRSFSDPTEIKTISNGYVEPVVFENITGLEKLDTEARKNAFIELLLPSILIVKDNINKERIRTLDLWSKLKSHDNISHDDSVFMDDLFRKYGTKNFAEINLKQQVHPNSIIIAQSALETGWGTSRFFLNGNNAFGIWSYNHSDERIMSLLQREDGLFVYLKKYKNIRGAVEDYFNTVASSWAFDEFRKRRAESDNAYELIWYLNMYSELRYDYVKKVGELIVQNKLTQFDTIRLDPDYFVKINIKK